MALACHYPILLLGGDLAGVATISLRSFVIIQSRLCPWCFSQWLSFILQVFLGWCHHIDTDLKLAWDLGTRWTLLSSFLGVFQQKMSGKRWHSQGSAQGCATRHSLPLYCRQPLQVARCSHFSPPDFLRYCWHISDSPSVWEKGTWALLKTA